MPPKKAPSKAVGGPGGSGKVTMTVAQLKYLAKTKNISLTGITKKADIIQALSGKEKMKKSPQKTKKVPTAKKVPTKKMTSPNLKDMKWAVLEIFKGGGEGAELFGLYPTKEEALYAIYLYEDEFGIKEMMSQFLDEGFIGDRGSAYHVVEINGGPVRQQNFRGREALSLSEFEKMVKKFEGGHEEKPRFVGKAKGKAKGKSIAGKSKSKSVKAKAKSVGFSSDSENSS